MNSKFSISIPMYIVFDHNICPKKASSTRFAIDMGIEDMLLYTNVMRMYVNGIYYGERVSNVHFDEL